MKADFQSGKFQLLCTFLLLVAYVAGLFVDIMQVDAAQYASIAREMAESGQWLQVHHRGSDYLDKPPLGFWLGALFIKYLGAHVWAYKLPVMLFAFAGFYGIYRLGILLYSQKTGLLAAFILASCLGWIMFNNDVRSDSLLATNIILGVWQLQSYRMTHKWRHLLAGFFFIALAMMAKGPLGVAIPAVALGSDMLMKKQWKAILDWRWLVGLLFMLLCLSPMLWGLYQQFDKHPEKIVNGLQGVSGLKFFFWTQSFGRITGENVWHNDSSPSLFFVHTFAWSFIPWSFMLLTSLVYFIRKWINKENIKGWVAMGGLIIPLVVLSFSHYKLPHYIYPVFPFAALLSAAFLSRDEIPRAIIFVQAGVNILLWATLTALAVYFFPLQSWVAYAVSAVFAVIFIFLLIELNGRQQLIFATLWTAVSIGLYYNLSLSPQLMTYPADNKISTVIENKKIPVDKLVSYQTGSHVVDFHLNTIVPFYYVPSQLDSILRKQPFIWVFTEENGRRQLIEEGFDITKSIAVSHYSVNEMSWGFFNPKTRNSVLINKWLLKISDKDRP